FPPIPEIAAECPIGGVVLQKSAREHSWRESIIGARSNHACGETSIRQIHTAYRKARFNGQPFCNRNARLADTHSRDIAVVVLALLQRNIAGQAPLLSEVVGNGRVVIVVTANRNRNAADGERNTQHIKVLIDVKIEAVTVVELNVECARLLARLQKTGS